MQRVPLPGRCGVGDCCRREGGYIQDVNGWLLVIEASEEKLRVVIPIRMPVMWQLLTLWVCSKQTAFEAHCEERGAQVCWGLVGS